MDVKEIRRRNLEVLVREAGTAAALAAKAETSPAYLSQISTGSPGKSGKARNVGDDLARKLESAMGKPRGWMDYRHDGYQPDSRHNVPVVIRDAERHMDYVSGENIHPGPDIQGGLPLISWVKAGGWAEVEDPFEPGEYERLVPVTRRYSNRAFALRVEGDSMQSADGTSFPNGSIICVEPMQAAKNGSYVVARLDDSMEATFKQLIIDGDRTYLKPLNPRYPIMPVEGELTICGVVRQLVMDFD